MALETHMKGQGCRSGGWGGGFTGSLDPLGTSDTGPQAAFWKDVQRGNRTAHPATVLSF